MNTETVLILLAGIVGLITTILKIKQEQDKKKSTPEIRYYEDKNNFDKALSENNTDDLSSAFELLRSESVKSGGDFRGENDKKITER